MAESKQMLRGLAGSCRLFESDHRDALLHDVDVERDRGPVGGKVPLCLRGPVVRRRENETGDRLGDEPLRRPGLATGRRGRNVVICTA
jgi:hypothetical protein